MEDRGDARLVLAHKELAGLSGRQGDDLDAAAAGFGVDLSITGSWPETPVPMISRGDDQGIASSADNGV